MKPLQRQNLNDWDEVSPSVLFAYNARTHSSTGFMPFFLIFREEARVPCEIVWGRPNSENSRTPDSFAYNLIRKLESAFDFDRENLHPAQNRMKESYDIGVNERIF